MKIREFRLGDLKIMGAWLEQDYIRNFWGDPQDWIKDRFINDEFFFFAWRQGKTK